MGVCAGAWDGRPYCGAMTQPRLIVPGAGEVLTGPGGDQMTVKLSAGATGDRLSLAEYDVPPGGGPPLHVHTLEDEAFWVLAGEVAFHCGGRVLEAKAGACVWAPRGVPHTFKNRSGTASRMLVLVTPAANFEAFYAKIGSPGPSGPPTDAEVIERIQRHAPEHGLTMMGPNPL